MRSARHYGRCAATILLPCLILGLCTADAAAQRAKHKSPKLRPENTFVTVDEFLRAKRPSGTLVSVEGYFVTLVRSGSSAVGSLVDSTDKVLSASDAAAMARTGARCTIAIGGKGRSRWTMTRKGLVGLAMYTGGSKPSTCVQDTPPKVRLQGMTGKGRGVLVSVRQIEYQDENGDWRILR